MAISTFLALLGLELDSLDEKDIYEPDHEVSPKDKKCGDLNDNLIKLYSLWQNCEKSAAEKMMEARYSRGTEDQKAEASLKAYELGSKASFIGELFWIEVKDTCHLWDKENIGVRRGRIVVWYEPEPPRIIGFGPFGPQSGD